MIIIDVCRMPKTDSPNDAPFECHEVDDFWSAASLIAHLENLPSKGEILDALSEDGEFHVADRMYYVRDWL